MPKGHYKRKLFKIDETGNRYGRLTVVNYSHTVVDKGNRRRIHWLCKCDCSKMITVNGASLRAASTKSCGCLKQERLVEIGKTVGSINLIEYSKSRQRHIIITKEMRDVLDGLIFADAHYDAYINARHIDTSVYFTLGTPYKKYAESVTNALTKVGIPDVKVTKSKGRNPSDESYFDTYTARTPSFIDLIDEWKRWYVPNLNFDSNKPATSYANRRFIKVIPKDFKLTPTSAYWLYVGDGSLEGHTVGKSKSNVIKLSTNCFHEDELRNIFVPQLYQLNIAAHVKIRKDRKNQPEVHMYGENVLRFLNYIGKPPYDIYTTKFAPFINYKNCTICGDRFYPKERRHITCYKNDCVREKNRRYNKAYKNRINEQRKRNCVKCRKVIGWRGKYQMCRSCAITSAKNKD